MTFSKRRTTAFFLIVALCALGTAEAQTPDRNKLWTTVGSAGTVDEADVAKVFFERGKVQIGQPLSSPTPGTAAATKPAAKITQTQTAVIRYNVTPVDGMFPPAPGLPPTIGTQLKVRFLDTGTRARVVARLVEVDLANGSETTRIVFDSNTFPPANTYQVRETGECNRRFDFVRKAYYIEATLTGGGIAIGNAAGIEIIKIANNPCLG